MPPPPRPRIEPAQASRLMQHGLVHHYPFKSEQDFLLRVARGVQGDFAGQALWKDLHATDQHRAVLARAPTPWRTARSPTSGLSASAKRPGAPQSCLRRPGPTWRFRSQRGKVLSRPSRAVQILARMPPGW